MSRLKRLIPNRRLSSKAIQNQLQANFVEEIVSKNLKVVTARLVWKTSRGELINAKRLITTKRNFADAIVARQQDVIYFFSCLTSVHERKRKHSSGAEEDAEPDQLPLIYPAINYWIVCAPGHQEFERILFQKLMDSQLDIHDLKPIKTRKKTNPKEILLATLSTTVQDHNNQYVRDLLKQSTEYCTKELLEELLIGTSVEPLRSSADLTGALVREQVIRIVICAEGVREKVMTAINGLRNFGCEIQVCIFGF